MSSPRIIAKNKYLEEFERVNVVETYDTYYSVDIER